MLRIEKVALSVRARTEPLQKSFSIHWVKTLPVTAGVHIRHVVDLEAREKSRGVVFALIVRGDIVGPNQEDIKYTSAGHTARTLRLHSEVLDFHQVLGKDCKLKELHVMPVIVTYSSDVAVFRVWIMEDKRYLNTLNNGFARPREWKVSTVAFKKNLLPYAIHLNDIARGYYKSYKENEVIVID